MHSQTIDDMYAAINSMPAMLSAKGKVMPEVTVLMVANAGLSILMTWKKGSKYPDWERDSEYFNGATFGEVVTKATSFINQLPSAEQAKLQQFMGELGKLIDAGKADGIELDYMNPLLDTMKRLSENAITYQPMESR